MFIKKIQLKNFRLFEDKILEFNEKATLILAPNAKGKSSVAEAIGLLSIGSSFRAGRIEEMIRLGEPLSRVRAKVVENEKDIDKDLEDLGEMELSALITRGEVNGRRSRKLLYRVNDNPRSKKKFVGKLLTVVFRPEDMRLVEGSPGRRRDFLDSPLVLTDYEYANSLSKYNQTLRRRNKLLSLIKEGKQSTQVLSYWDMALVKHGELLQKQRREFLDFINASVEPPLKMRIKYLPSLISAKGLADRRYKETAAGFTLIGPHKDDFEILIEIDHQLENQEMKSLDAYGSRGQKRMGVVWLKKAELAFLKQQTQRLPVLILDDVLSELDQENDERVLELINSEQVIITSVEDEVEDMLKKKFKNLSIIRLQSTSKPPAE